MNQEALQRYGAGDGEEEGGVGFVSQAFLDHSSFLCQLLIRDVPGKPSWDARSKKKKKKKRKDRNQQNEKTSKVERCTRKNASGRLFVPLIVVCSM